MFHHLLSFNIDFCTTFAVLIFIKLGVERGGSTLVWCCKKGDLGGREKGSNAGSFVSKRWLRKEVGRVCVCVGVYAKLFTNDEESLIFWSFSFNFLVFLSSQSHISTLVAFQPRVSMFGKRNVLKSSVLALENVINFSFNLKFIFPFRWLCWEIIICYFSPRFIHLLTQVFFFAFLKTYY